MWARVRTDDGEHSEYWFDVMQGVQQGCVLSSLRFNMIFAAGLHVVLVRFTRTNTSFVQNLAHLDDDRARRDEGPFVACVWRAVWGILHADDAGIVSIWEEGLPKMIESS